MGSGGGSGGGGAAMDSDMRARLSMLYGQPNHSHPPPLVMPHPTAGKHTVSHV